jgi:hypothetical protein
MTKRTKITSSRTKFRQHLRGFRVCRVLSCFDMFQTHHLIVPGPSQGADEKGDMGSPGGAIAVQSKIRKQEYWSTISCTTTSHSNRSSEKRSDEACPDVRPEAAMSKGISFTQLGNETLRYTQGHRITLLKMFKICLTIIKFANKELYIYNGYLMFKKISSSN